MTQAGVLEIQRTVVLTAHPLQRVGAFALAELVKVEHPDQLSPEKFDEATGVMARHLLGTVDVDSSKDPGGFWLAASYLFWPNSPMNPTNRKKQSQQERRDRITQWRALPDRAEWPGVPCSLCGRAACGYYGKVDIPLGASTAYRNTTPPDHAGLALCLACVSSFHALPYGCQIGGGRAAALHSWDTDFLQEFVCVQVARTLQQAMVGTAGPATPSPYWREVTALRQLRSHSRRLSAGVELIVFSNSNKEQVLDEHAMDQPLAEWLRCTVRGSRPGGFGYLARAHRTKNVPGTAMLARQAFRAPQQVIRRVVTFLRAVAEHSAVPGEAPHLVPLSFSYAIEVLQVNKKDVDRICQLAEHIAETLAPHRERGVLKGYENAHRESRRLQEWLQKRAVSWALTSPEGRAGPFVTSDQWRLLFDPDGRSWLHQDLLFIAVLEQLHERGWRADDATARDDLDDDLIDGLIAEENQ